MERKGGVGGGLEKNGKFGACGPVVCHRPLRFTIPSYSAGIHRKALCSVASAPHTPQIRSRHATYFLYNAYLLVNPSTMLGGQMSALEKLFGKKKVQTKKAVLTPSLKKSSVKAKPVAKKTIAKGGKSRGK